MAMTRIEDEYTPLDNPKKRYYMRLMRDRKAMQKCIRCPVWDLKDGLLVERVRTDGSLYTKRLLYCAQHREYCKGWNRKMRDKRRGQA